MTVTKQMLQGSVVVVVVVVVGHGPQSCGHVGQSSEGPHSPSPHTQLQGGDPPVQLQRPALQSAMTCLRQAPLACPLKPLAATSSLQAFRPHGEEAVATGDTMAAPSASIAKPARTLRATMADLLRLVRPLACQLTTPHVRSQRGGGEDA